MFAKDFACRCGGDKFCQKIQLKNQIVKKTKRLRGTDPNSLLWEETPPHPPVDDRAKKVRARLREERLKRIARYKARSLALLLPPFGE
ncbi:hypothetical protein DY000_02006117 [Brassica cretica]|uniref:Ribosome biogenesis protein NOP53 n=1 Tax=Brassica cretica TaxID=69181 RepID=A0ABQ7C280_BRACR|nr:hypothetical protein DY000_02006117 [Brassica cretica]